jgi:hypothetical protein
VALATMAGGSVRSATPVERRRNRWPAEWFARAVRNQANLEAAERILPPAPRSAGPGPGA